MVSIFTIGTIILLNMVPLGDCKYDNTYGIDVDSNHHPTYMDRVQDGVNMNNKVHAASSAVTAVTSVAEASGNFGWPAWPDPGSNFMADFDGRLYVDTRYQCLEHHNFMRKQSKHKCLLMSVHDNFSFKEEEYAREAASAAIESHNVARRAATRPVSAVDSTLSHKNCKQITAQQLQYMKSGQENFTFKLDGTTMKDAFTAIAGLETIRRAEVQRESAVESISNHTNQTQITGLMNDIIITAMHPLPYLSIFFSCFICVMLWVIAFMRILWTIGHNYERARFNDDTTSTDDDITRTIHNRRYSCKHYIVYKVCHECNAWICIACGMCTCCLIECMKHELDEKWELLRRLIVTLRMIDTILY